MRPRHGLLVWLPVFIHSTASASIELSELNNEWLKSLVDVHCLQTSCAEHGNGWADVWRSVRNKSCRNCPTSPARSDISVWLPEKQKCFRLRRLRSSPSRKDSRAEGRQVPRRSYNKRRRRLLPFRRRSSTVEPVLVRKDHRRESNCT